MKVNLKSPLKGLGSLLLLLTLLSPTLHAQTGRYLFHLRVEPSFLDNHVLIAPSAPASLEFEEGKEAQALRKWHSNDRPDLTLTHKIRYNGTVDDFDHPVQSFIIPPKGGDPNEVEVVRIEAITPLKIYETRMFELLRLGIELTDVQGEPYMTSDAILTRRDQRAMEAAVFENIHRDLALTATEMRKQMDPVMIESGMFEGKDIFTVMENVTDGNIRDFLDYMILKPSKYMGNVWKFSEVFATWLVAGAPGAKPSLVDEILIQENMEKRIQLTKNLTTDELTDLVQFLYSKGVELRKAGEGMLAVEHLESAAEIAKAHGYHSEAAEMFFSLGDLLGSLEMHLDAAHAFEKSVASALLAEETVYAAITTYNIAVQYNNAGEYKKAFEAIDKTMDEHEVLFDGIEEGSVKAAMALGYLNKGRALAGMGKHKKAKEAFDKGILHLRGHEFKLALKRRAMLYFALSDSLAEMGNQRGARQYEEMALETAEKSLDAPEE